ncbi:MAG: hypothetical protein V1755_02615 [Chloroflexota bacterium]
MLLNLSERFMLLEILPAQGDFATLKIVRKLREALSLTEAEFKKYRVRTAGQMLDDGTVVPEGRIVWNAVGQEPREIEIGEKAADIIADVFKKLDREKKLTEQHIDLYEKFIP